MIYFFLVVMVSVIAFLQYSKKFLNPYKLFMVFGKKGSGKSTLLTKLCLDYIKKGRPVYSTLPVPGTYHLDAKDIGYKYFPPNSVLMIDEVGMIWDNRNFKKFDEKVRDFFKLQRHYKLVVYLFSQTFDIDKKLRDLTDHMYLVEKKARVFTWAKRITKRVVLNKSTAEAPSKIDEDLVFDPLLFFWAGTRRFTFIPKYVKYFDSFTTPELPRGENERYSYDDFPKIKRWIDRNRPQRRRRGGKRK